MGYELRTKARLLGGDLHAKAKLGPIYKEVVAPEDFLGPYEYTPTGAFTIPIRDQLATEDIRIAVPPTEEITITENGVYVPAEGKVGFSRVTVTEEWDGILLPPEDGLGFYIKQVLIHPGERLRIEGCGYGGRWWSIRAGGGVYNKNNGFGTSFGWFVNGVELNSIMTFTTPPFIYDTLVNIAGYEWRNDGGRYTDSGADPSAIYEFRGEYMKWKIIHAS